MNLCPEHVFYFTYLNVCLTTGSEFISDTHADLPMLRGEYSLSYCIRVRLNVLYSVQRVVVLVVGHETTGTKVYCRTDGTATTETLLLLVSFTGSDGEGKLSGVVSRIVPRL